MYRRLPVAAFIFILTSATAFAQDPPAAWTDAQMEAFLKTARIVSTRRIGVGVTNSVRATLSDGTFTHDAHIQNVDLYKAEFRTPKGGIERNFRDSWRYNIAAYRIDRMLDLRLVPVSVERAWRGRPAAFTWWVDDVMMDEGRRIAKSLVAPDYRCFSQHAQTLRMFDRLIENTDRNFGNTLYSKNWRMWAIDHTRAFRRSPQPEMVADLTMIDRRVLDRLAALELRSLKVAVGKYVNGPELRRLLSRRDGLLAHYNALPVHARVERPDPSAGCAVRRANAAPSSF